MLTLQQITYAHPNKDVLFDQLNLTINKNEKIALIGNNGAGKSTLLKIMAGLLLPLNGELQTETLPYYIPQHFGQFNQQSVAEALHIGKKLEALHAILAGEVTEAHFNTLDDDWDIEERCREALAHWDLEALDLSQPMSTLSGGQKTKVFLAGIRIHRPQLVLMDEPSNHLDTQSRMLLYDYIQSTNDTLIVVSHDRTLLDILPVVYELGKQGITIYGGNYTFYTMQKTIEVQALQEGLKDREKALRKAREVERETIERQQKLDARGKRKQEKAGIPTIAMNTLRNNAEKSTAKTKEVHAEKVEALHKEVGDLRRELPDKDKMKLGFGDTALHNGKILVTAKEINCSYGTHFLWKTPLSLQITSGQRLAIKGHNGSGKTSLIRIILGQLEPSSGTIQRTATDAIYIDQDYSLIDNRLSVYEQAERYNTGRLQEHEVKSRLTHFLFQATQWHKSCAALSGGEKMRLILCCLTIGAQAPDMIVLDEPTNNLDIQNIEILTEAINSYRGTLIVVSHDALFLEQAGVNEAIVLV
ncbi:ABC-F family ATP-binding cassette domain-containing protein [Taibaiella koreensis]|uniref:ABC-F family ATP-binding cassette domain-containing protein n=1 Tax=Taibaiella koreensis TaxID=1268548 RepID=UPI000E5A00E6|nr:ABC-F family ATP-binding cassette domain-containing protein [Taibaiella koreensis]